MLATNAESHRVLSKALTERDDGYRQWMRPADIIEQNAIERRSQRRKRLAGVLEKFLRRLRDILIGSRRGDRTKRYFVTVR